MSLSEKQFEEIIDNMISPDLQESLNIDLRSSNMNSFDYMNLIEKARVYTIKQKISSTHKWEKAKVFYPGDGPQNRFDIFWCTECNLKASVFDHIKTLSIISKVEDRLPSYTIHNKYIMHTCEAVQEFRRESGMYECFDCGISEKEKTIDCNIVSVN